MRQEAAVTRVGRLIIPSVATSRPCERGWLRTDVDRDAVADHGVLWHFRWREAVALHDDAAPSEGSAGEQQRAGRRGWASFPCLLVDEQVLAGSRERVHGRAVRADQMHPADSIERSIRSNATKKRSLRRATILQPDRPAHAAVHVGTTHAPGAPNPVAGARDDAPKPVPARDTATRVVTFIGHATFLIQTEAGNVLTDPMFSERAGPWNLFGPRRVRPPAMALDALPPISIVLLSHNHYDHCDLPTLRRWRGDSTLLWLRRWATPDCFSRRDCDASKNSTGGSRPRRRRWRSR